MIQRHTLYSPALRRLTLPFGSLCAALLTAGCAQLPDLGESPRLQPASAFQAAVSLQAPQAAWPTAQWWAAYGDPQLSALIDEALATSPDLAVASARLQRAQAMTQIAGSALQPQVNANASFSADKLSYNHLTPRAMTPEGFNDYGRATLELRWVMDFWGKNRAALVAATSEQEAGRAELAQTQLLLAADIAANYAELSRLHANRDIAVQAIDIRHKTAVLLAQRFDNGLENQGNVRQAEALRATAEGDLLALDELIAVQRHRLAALLGAGPDRGLSIARPSLKLDRSVGLPAQLSANLLGRRPDVVAARLQAQAQASRINQKKAEFYPDINLSAFVGLQSLGLDLLTRSGSGVGGVGPALSLPLFTGGRLPGELRGTQAAYAETVANYNATVARALQEVADAATRQQALGPRLVKAQESVAAARAAHRIARNRYEGGLANVLDVLSAEAVLLGSVSALTNLRAASVSLDVALQRALGGGYTASHRFAS